MGVPWAWYAGGWDAANLDGRQDPKVKRSVISNPGPDSLNFQTHHQPFNYYERFAPGTVDRARHLKDEQQFLADLDRGMLPAVAFFKPSGRRSGHPGLGDLVSSDRI